MPEAASEIMAEDGEPSTSNDQNSGRSAKDKDCLENIVIPPQLPQILKLYTKSAMRTQPKDLLRWTLTYMRAMAEGRPPPVKDRGEAEPVEMSPAGLSPGFLRVLHMMLKDKNPDGKVSANDVRTAWEDLSFDPNDIEEVLDKADLTNGRVNDWRKVLVVFANTIPPTGDVAQTMRVVCEVLTEQPDGAEPYINYALWWELYVYLAKVVRNILSEKIKKVSGYLLDRTKQNFCLIGPRDFLNSDCPPLS
ncbi:unnamed protein product [Orchesella dallaii]|uniref:Ropporin-1-like protein n=1 Tax=Orchesella dallaii TaxID=48710 RepID=A0ABP1RDA0_9HEXA